MSSYEAVGGWRVRLVAVVAAVVALVLVMVPPAQAEERGGGRKVDLIAGGGFSMGEIVDDLPCPEAPAGTTLLAARVTRQFDEAPGVTFVGGGSSESCFYLDEETNAAYGFGESEFDGELAGCGEGRGTMRFRYVATITAPDPDTGVRHGSDVAWFVPGSGTGALASVSAGKFTGTTDIAPDLTFDGPLQGWVKC